jgi:hypothetical protein
VRREWAERRAWLRLSNAKYQRDVIAHRRELLRAALHAALESKDRDTAKDLIGRIKVLDKEYRSACDEVRAARMGKVA